MKKIIIPPVFVLLSLILIVLFYIFVPQYNIIPYPFNFLGIAVSFGGIVIMGKARDLFKQHATTLAIEPSSFLIKDGIFSKTRNPMYIGFFLLLLGIAICFMNAFSLCCPFGFFISMQLIFIPKEEKLMMSVFGQAYLDYKKQVRRWI